MKTYFVSYVYKKDEYSPVNFAWSIISNTKDDMDTVDGFIAVGEKLKKDLGCFRVIINNWKQMKVKKKGKK